MDLFRWHIGDLGGGAEEDVLFELEAQVLERGRLRRTAHENAVVAERAVVVEGRVGLGDDVLLLFVGGQVDDLVGDLALGHDAVGRFDETEQVHLPVGGQCTDEPDVRALGGLDRAHAAIVREVDVADLEACSLARQAARAERREATTVGEAGERVDLVHELRELAGAEELLDRGDHRPDVDECHRRDRLDVLGGHALADDAFHAGEADADLVLDELADRADAPVGEVVLVVEAVAGLAHGEAQQVGAGGQHLGAGEDGLVGIGYLEFEPEQLLAALDLGAEFAVQLVAADPGQVVAARLEEGVAQVGACGFDGRRFAGTHALVDLQQCHILRRLAVAGLEFLFPTFGKAFLLPLAIEEVEVVDELLEESGLVDLVVAEGTQQGEYGEAALPGDLGAGGDVLAGLLLDVELDPLAAVRMDGAGDELVLGHVAEAEALSGLEDHAG